MRKGQKTTEETRKKMSNAKIGNKSRLGKKHTEETREKMSKSAKIAGTGKWTNGAHLTKEVRKKISESHKGERHHFFGKHLSLNHRNKISQSSSGAKGNNWKGGKTKSNLSIRHSLEYKLWREAVFKRDNYTCIWCNQRGGELNADHILPFADYPEHRFSIDNGRTLCKSCHIKRHKKD